MAIAENRPATETFCVGVPLTKVELLSLVAGEGKEASASARTDPKIWKWECCWQISS